MAAICNWNMQDKMKPTEQLVGETDLRVKWNASKCKILKAFYRFSKFISLLQIYNNVLFYPEGGWRVLVDRKLRNVSSVHNFYQSS
jgi:hypothetical protein